MYGPSGPLYLKVMFTGLCGTLLMFPISITVIYKITEAYSKWLKKEDQQPVTNKEQNNGSGSQNVQLVGLQNQTGPSRNINESITNSKQIREMSEIEEVS